jgi:hypothetical protein
MNTLDLLYRIYRARYSLDALQRRLDKSIRVVFVGEREDTDRMLGWLGELHPQAREMPVELRTWPVEDHDWESVRAAVIHLGRSVPSLELLRERAESVPDRIPCLWVVEGLDVELPDSPPGTLPQILRLDPIDPAPIFGHWLTRAFPGLAVSLARDFAQLRYLYARQLIRHTAARNARMALASTLKPPALPVVGVVWKFFATTGETIAMTASQIQLCLLMAALHHRSVDFFDRMGELWPVIGSSFGWRGVARGLVGLVPGLGWLTKGSLAYGGTWMVGELSRLYYEYGQPKQEEVLREIRRRAQDDLVAKLRNMDLDKESDESAGTDI